MRTWSDIPPAVKLGFLGIVSVSVLGARLFWISPSGALWFQTHLGYYVVLALVILWSICLLRAARLRKDSLRGLWHDHRSAWGVIVCATAFLHLHEPHLMRVLYDEPSHALCALVMHQDKQALVAGQANYVGDIFALTHYYASYRQYLFSLLVSLLHDFTGYRVANIFILNFLLTPVVLLSAYLIGLKLRGRIAGLVAILLLGSLPLLAQNATGGGYDVLNLALLGVLILTTLVYVEAPESERGVLMDLSLATLLLLALARSESILYVFPWAFVTLWLWWREHRLTITGFAALSPLFLLPNLMINLVMSASPATMDAGLRKEGVAFFDVSNLPKHAAEALYYIFNFDRGSTNGVLLATLGGVGFIALVVYVAKALLLRSLRSAESVFALYAISVGVVYAFILTNFWGSPTDPLAARFALPLMLIGALTGGWFIVQLDWLRKRPAWVWGALGIWYVVAAAPAMSRSYVTHAMVVGGAEGWFLDFAKGRDRTSTLYVGQSNVTFIVHRYAASGLRDLEDDPARFIRALKAGLYREIIVFQLLEGEATLEGGILRPGGGPEEKMMLETVCERLMSPTRIARISRLVGYRKADGTLVTPASDDPDIALRDSFSNRGDWQAYRWSLYP